MSLRPSVPAEGGSIFQGDMTRAVPFSKVTDVFGIEVDGVDIAAGVSEKAKRDSVGIERVLYPDLPQAE